MNASLLSLVALLVSSAAVAVAAAAAPATAAAPAAQASGPGPGPASAPGMGGRHRGRFGPDHPPGWALMTPEERTDHRSRMQAMNSRDECIAYTEQHHARMAARAQERGRTLPAKPRHDACAGLKP